MVGGPAPVERGPQTITIQRGQTLSEIAHSYHVPMRVIAEANGLSPPYRIQVGRTLVIPGAGLAALRCGAHVGRGAASRTAAGDSSAHVAPRTPGDGRPGHSVGFGLSRLAPPAALHEAAARP